VELAAIYRPVADDLVRVEARLKELPHNNLDWLPAETGAALRRHGRIEELLQHILAGGGKRLRPALVLLGGSLFNYRPERLLPMAVAVETMHIATLVHDDAIDHSDLRWGRPTVNRRWDADTAILLGDYLLAQAAAMATETGDIRVMRRLGETLMTITAGELAQSFSAFALEESRQNYLERIGSKTAALFILSVESGAILGGAPEAGIGQMREYGRHIGMAFQVIDDVLDYAGTAAELGKPIGADLREGTLTLPAMLFLERYPEANPVRAVFEGRDREANLERAISAIQNAPDIIRDSYRLAGEHIQSARSSLAGLPEGTGRTSLEALADFIISRHK